MQKLPDTLDNMNRTFNKANDSLARVHRPTGPDKKSPVERMVNTINMTERTLRKFSEPSADGQPAPADQIAKAMENISEITRSMRSIMCRIDQGEGSFGRLLNDRQLYDRINCAATEHRASQPASSNRSSTTPGCSSDKVARHPGCHRSRRRQTGDGNEVGWSKE